MLRRSVSGRLWKNLLAGQGWVNGALNDIIMASSYFRKHHRRWKINTPALAGTTGITPDAQSESQQMRLESDQHLVQISPSINQYGIPLVGCRFICNFQAGGQRLYHDETTFEPPSMPLSPG